ncbi:MAG: cyanobactin biosynthesis system PatB/AcyB/McaB family protein [Xenococcaceae cyanobacterium MO_207.B15]|nr:cyanobactin biosynthesis system PatB/AcyB/McaB family protein [Xenococcaceae cyanobacterium MO_207.B15]
MKLPIQAPPVIRTDLFKPHTVVDVIHASKSSLLEKQLNLLHGANYNDPMRFLMPADYSGCHLFSGNSMAMCLAVKGFF